MQKTLKLYIIIYFLFYIRAPQTVLHFADYERDLALTLGYIINQVEKFGPDDEVHKIVWATKKSAQALFPYIFFIPFT